MLLAAASQPDTLRLTLGIICFLVFIIVLIFGVINPLSRRSRRERGLPKKGRRWGRRQGKHSDRDSGES